MTADLPAEVLIVDDDPDICFFLQMALSHEGYHARTAATAADAITEIHKRMPDVLLLDVMMPDVSGEELCGILKRDSQLKQIIIFMLSADPDVQTKLRCFKNGAEEYLVKPVDPEEISARIQQFLKLRRKIRRDMEEVETHALTDAKKYGHYVVESLAGSGGMGEVYKAVDPGLERLVAIKVLPQQLCRNRHFVLRFRREARLLASMNHPHIAAVFNFGVEHGEVYFAMQWCPGGSLSELLAGGRRIDILRALEWTRQCAEALSEASKKGIVHRDIKPGNLMFDESGAIKLVDFGLAYAEKSSRQGTDVSEFHGTPLYMSPEQAKTNKIDHRSDIYSLGITLYQMVYGRTPFSGDSPVEVLLKHATHPFPEFEDLGGAVPYAVYRIIELMTRKSPDERYQDYVELIADLDRELTALRTPRIEDLTEVSLHDLVSDNDAGTSAQSCLDVLGQLYLDRKDSIVLLHGPSGESGIAVRDRRIFGVHPGTDLRGTLENAIRQSACKAEIRDSDVSPPAGESIPLADVLLEACRCWAGMPAITESIREEDWIRKTGVFNRAIEGLNLTPLESYVAYRIEGDDTRLNSLRVLTGLPDEQILRTVFLLMKIGAVRIGSGQDTGKP